MKFKRGDIIINPVFRSLRMVTTTTDNSIALSGLECIFQHVCDSQDLYYVEEDYILVTDIFRTEVINFHYGEKYFEFKKR